MNSHPRDGHPFAEVVARPIEDIYGILPEAYCQKWLGGWSHSPSWLSWWPVVNVRLHGTDIAHHGRQPSVHRRFVHPGKLGDGNSAHFGTAQDGTVIQWVPL